MKNDNSNIKPQLRPVIEIGIEPKNPTDLPKLDETLKAIAKDDLELFYFRSEAGGNVIQGMTEMHLEATLEKLKNLCGIDTKKTDPRILYLETIQEESEAFTRSLNKKVTMKMKYTPFEPENIVYVSSSEGIIFENNVSVKDLPSAECIDSILKGLEWSTKEGPLTDSPVVGAKVTLVEFHYDPKYGGSSSRGASDYGEGMVAISARRNMQGGMLMGKPTLLEPIYLVEIICSAPSVGGIYGVLNKRRGHVISEEPQPPDSQIALKAYLPAKESFGFTEALSASTGGQAKILSMKLDNYAPLPGDCLDPGSKSYEIITNIRTRTGLNPKVPSLDRFIDMP